MKTKYEFILKFLAFAEHDEWLGKNVSNGACRLFVIIDLFYESLKDLYEQDNISDCHREFVFIDIFRERKIHTKEWKKVFETICMFICSFYPSLSSSDEFLQIDERSKINYKSFLKFKPEYQYRDYVIPISSFFVNNALEEIQKFIFEEAKTVPECKYYHELIFRSQSYIHGKSSWYEEREDGAFGRKNSLWRLLPTIFFTIKMLEKYGYFNLK